MRKDYHLLLIDDNEFLRETLARFLRTHYHVTNRPSGERAIDWLQQGHQPDLIIVDLEMPHFNGLDMLRHLRASRSHFHTPVIILTDADDSQTRIKCLELGADACLSKPFNPSELAAKSNALLRRVSHYDTARPEFAVLSSMY